MRFKIVDWFWFPETPQSVRDAMVANKPYEVWTETEDIWGFDGATRLAEGTTDASGRAWIPDSIVGPVTVHLWQDCVYNFAGPATIDESGNEQLESWPGSCWPLPARWPRTTGSVIVPGMPAP